MTWSVPSIPAHSNDSPVKTWLTCSIASIERRSMGSSRQRVSWPVPTIMIRRTCGHHRSLTSTVRVGTRRTTRTTMLTRCRCSMGTRSSSLCSTSSQCPRTSPSTTGRSLATSPCPTISFGRKTRRISRTSRIPALARCLVSLYRKFHAVAQFTRPLIVTTSTRPTMEARTQSASTKSKPLRSPWQTCGRRREKCQPGSGIKFLSVSIVLSCRFTSPTLLRDRCTRQSRQKKATQRSITPMSAS